MTIATVAVTARLSNPSAESHLLYHQNENCYLPLTLVVVSVFIGLWSSTSSTTSCFTSFLGRA
jgi:hypothetical protein